MNRIYELVGRISTSVIRRFRMYMADYAPIIRPTRYFAWGCFRDFVFELRGVPPKRVDGWSEAIPINWYSWLDGFRKGLNPSYGPSLLHPTRYLLSRDGSSRP